MSRKPATRRVAPHIIGTPLNPTNSPVATTQHVGGVTVTEMPVSPSATWEQEYGYVRRDLKRILLFASLLIGIMLVLRFVVGL